MDEPGKLRRGPLIVIETDSRLAITGWSRRAAQVFETDPAAAVGRDLAEVLPLAGPADWRSLLTDADDDEPRVWSIRRPEGPLAFEAWAQIDRDAEGRPLGVTLYGHDATARLAREARLALESTLLTAIKDNLEIVMWAIDEQGLFLYQDGKALRTAGIEPHQFVGQSMLEIYKDVGHNELIMRGLAGESIRTPTAETHGVHWDTYYMPVDGAPGEARLIGVSLDVSEVKRGELEMRAKLELIERQQEVIRELATPLIEVWDGVLTMPIVGLVDTARTAEIMDSLLQGITQTRARFAILDLTGVEVVDTGTASHLIRMIQAVRLLGAEGILTGIHPLIAQTIVALGVDLTHVAVYAKLRDALKHCIRVGRQARPA
ncbi:STAS domain-containing protein [Nannocystis radixulma]|uniref:PAS domain-containing protein n=1 Tax=Nannocystis radixulma TaxID=2995305 RepID=A0ABT5BJ41_9BACT|nr:STAS domain-containing protein [Nannocystis radixulma]MDC0673418.1 PAS domain-containing protein [Nannocystis radixulma]